MTKSTHTAGNDAFWRSVFRNIQIAYVIWSAMAIVAGLTVIIITIWRSCK